MATSILTPLQLTATASLLQNQGIRSLPASLLTAIDTFNATTVISNWLAAVSFYKAQSFFTETTLDALLSIGSTVCPALGNSIPAAPVGTYTNLINEYLTIDTIYDDSTVDPSGFSMLIEQTGKAYLGDGDIGRLAQGFMAVQGYINTTNNFINTSLNANEYLGPTFTNMDNLVTGDIASINTNLPAFGQDLAAQGQLVDLSKLELYGTPAGLLQQISSVAKIQGQALPQIQEKLLAAGLSISDISTLINNNRVGLFNPTGVSDNEFDRLQKIAYSAFADISGDDLALILDILDITTPNITSLGQLLNPVVMFPNSFATMQTPSPDGPIAIFGSNGAVNSNIAPTVSSYLPTASGCDELGKIIPPANATANKAIQVSLQQVGGIADNTLPEFAEVIKGYTDSVWNINDEYLVNSIVADNGTNYLAVQDVPIGTDITDTDYWTPTNLGGLSTMADLPLIQAQTTPVDSSVTSYFDTSIATGSGPGGVITTYDVLGLALDINDFASQLDTATTAINALQGAGSLNTLNTAYTTILAAGNDAAVLTQITNANNAIAALSASPYVTTLNTAWNYMANYLNIEKGYQIQAGVDYFNLQAGEKVSVYGFVQNLPAYGQLTQAGDAAEYLENIADTNTLGGQAIVGVLREGRNQVRLQDAGILTANQIPADPPVDPIPEIVPVN